MLVRRRCMDSSCCSEVFKVRSCSIVDDMRVDDSLPGACCIQCGRKTAPWTCSSPCHKACTRHVVRILFVVVVVLLSCSFDVSLSPDVPVHRVIIKYIPACPVCFGHTCMPYYNHETVVVEFSVHSTCGCESCNTHRKANPYRLEEHLLDTTKSSSWHGL